MGQCLSCFSQEKPSKEEVSIWLEENGLGQYTTKFEEHGWDEISLLLEMTDAQIEKCISKPGHIARFKRALEIFQPDKVTTIDSRRHMQATYHREVPGGSAEEDSTSKANDSDASTVKLTYAQRLGRPAMDKNSVSSDDEFFSTRSSVATRMTSEDDSNDARPRHTDKIVAQLLQGEADWRAKESYKTAIEPEPEEREGEGHSEANSETGTENKESSVSSEKESIHLSDTSLNVIDQMEQIADWYERRDGIFVETSAYEQFNMVVDEVRWANILGKPGDGKTAMAGHLMLKYRNEQGYKPVFITSPKDWVNLTSKLNSDLKDTKHFIIIDDMFGNSYVDKQKVSEWQSLIEEMQETVLKGKGDIRVVTISRQYIFNEIRTELEKFKMFQNLFVIDMSDEYKLTSDEKGKVFIKFAAKYDVSDFNPLVFREVDPPHGFPHCCELFCTDGFFRQNGIAFFEKPIEYIKNDIYNFKDNNCVEFAVLLLVLVNNNHLEKSYFDTLDSVSEEVKKIIRDAAMSLDRLEAQAQKALARLTKTYLTIGPDGAYCFSHDLLAQILAFVYYSVSPSHAIEVLDFSYILAFVNVGKLDENITLEESLRVSNQLSTSCAKALARRMTTELKHGNMTVVGYCDVWRNQAFVSEWMKYVTSGSNSNLSNLNQVPLQVSQEEMNTSL